MDEWIDVLDEDGNLTGRSVMKSEAHAHGIWHRCFHCWVFGRDASGRDYLLIQRRSPEKETWPGELDVTVAGHLGAGEEPLDGRRELEEEIGLAVEPERLVSIGVRKIDRDLPEGGADREFHHVYLLFDSTPPEDFVLQREEVDAILSVTLSDAELMANGEEVSATEFRADKTTRTTRVSLPEMVGDEGDYLNRVISDAKERLFRT